MKKRLAFMAVLFCLIFTMAVPAGAAPQVIENIETVTTSYGDFEVEETLVIYSAPRSNTKSAKKTQTIRNSGAVVAEVTLNATFGYDGKTAWVASASSTYTTYDGWSYGSERISKSGGTATLTATLTKTGAKNIPVSVSITCSASGTIS